MLFSLTSSPTNPPKKLLVPTLLVLFLKINGNVDVLIMLWIFHSFRKVMVRK